MEPAVPRLSWAEATLHLVPPAGQSSRIHQTTNPPPHTSGTQLPQESSDGPLDAGQATAPETSQQPVNNPSEDVEAVGPSGGLSQPSNALLIPTAPRRHPRHVLINTEVFRQRSQCQNQMIIRYEWPSANSWIVEHAAVRNFLVHHHPQISHLRHFTGFQLEDTFVFSENEALLPFWPAQTLHNLIVSVGPREGINSPLPVRYGDHYDKFIGPSSMLPASQRRAQPDDRLANITMDNRTLLQWRQARHLAGLDTRFMDEEVVYRIRENVEEWAAYGGGMGLHPNIQALAIHCLFFMYPDEREREIYDLDHARLDVGPLHPHFVLHHAPIDEETGYNSEDEDHAPPRFPSDRISNRNSIYGLRVVRRNGAPYWSW